MVKTQRYYHLFFFLLLSRATDIGMIGYFEVACPQNWQVYTPAQQKFIFTAGGAYKTGSTGGEFQHLLIIQEMPSHVHTLTAEGRHGQNYAWAYDFYSDWGDVPHEARSKVSSATGGNMPHNNMPPYLTLIACKKIRQNTFNSTFFQIYNQIQTLKAQLSNSNSQIQALKGQLNMSINQAQTLKGQINANNIQIQTLKTSIGTNTLQIQTLKTSFNTNSIQLQALKNQYSVSTMQTLKAQLNANFMEIQTLKAQFSACIVLTVISLTASIIFLVFILCERKKRRLYERRASSSVSRGDASRAQQQARE